MPSYVDVLTQLYQGLAPFAQENNTMLHEETELMADLGLDSMRAMELLMEIEERFDVSIPINVLSEVVTIRDLVLQIQRQLGDSDGAL